MKRTSRHTDRDGPEDDERLAEYLADIAWSHSAEANEAGLRGDGDHRIALLRAAVRVASEASVGDPFDPTLQRDLPLHLINLACGLFDDREFEKALDAADQAMAAERAAVRSGAESQVDAAWVPSSLRQARDQIVDAISRNGQQRDR